MAKAKPAKTDTATNTSKVQRIRIRLKSYDHRLIDKSADQIVDTAKRTGQQFVDRCRCQLASAFIVFCALPTSTKNHVSILKFAYTNV